MQPISPHRSMSRRSFAARADQGSIILARSARLARYAVPQRAQNSRSGPHNGHRRVRDIRQSPSTRSANQHWPVSAEGACTASVGRDGPDTLRIPTVSASGGASAAIRGSALERSPASRSVVRRPFRGVSQQKVMGLHPALDRRFSGRSNGTTRFACGRYAPVAL